MKSGLVNFSDSTMDTRLVENNSMVGKDGLIKRTYTEANTFGQFYQANDPKNFLFSKELSNSTFEGEKKYKAAMLKVNKKKGINL